MAGHLLTLLIALPAFTALACLLVRPQWVRPAALGGALAAFLLALAACIIHPQERTPSLRERWEAPGGVLDAAIAGAGLRDAALHEATRGLLLGGLPADELLEPLVDELCGVDLAAAQVQALRALDPADPARLGEAKRFWEQTQSETARVARTLRGLERELRGLRVAAASSTQAEFKLVEHRPWIAELGVHWFLGVDGLAAALLLLTCFLGLLCVAHASFREGEREAGAERRSCVLLLALQAGLCGLLASLDLVLFAGFWFLVLPPAYLLIEGGPESPGAAVGLRYLLPGFLGGLALLVAFLLLYLEPGQGTFNLLALHEAARSGALAGGTQDLVFVCLLAGCLVRVPLFPFHGWLPAAQAHLSPAGSAFVQGMLIKTGVFGLLRLAWPLCPETLSDGRVLTGLGLVACVTVVHGALNALAQRELSRTLAHVSVAHMGLATLGLCALTPAGTSGAGLLLISHGLAMAGAVLVAGALERRTGERELGALGGLARPLPILCALAGVFLASLAGCPGLAGFGPLLLLGLGTGSSALPLWLSLPALGAFLLAAAALAWCFGRIFLGELTRPELASLRDLDPGESASLAPLALACLALGILPRLALDLLGPSLEVLSAALAGLPG